MDLADAIREAGPHHEIRTVADEGWRGVKNGALLQRARESGFVAIVTADRRMQHQQNIPRSGLAFVVLHSPRIRIQELAPMAPAISAALDTIEPGMIVHIDARTL